MSISASHLFKGLPNHQATMKDLAATWRHLSHTEIRPSSTPTSPSTTRPSHPRYTPRHYTPRYRSLIPALLFLLCIPIFFYHLVPRYTSSTDTLISSLAHKLHSPAPTSSSCTKGIGSLQCCALFLAAAPCQDECRKMYVDRETMALTKEYDDCADKCLGEYEKACGKEMETKTEKGEEEVQTKTGPPRQKGSRTAE